jgi:MscS family membrane protein
MPIEPFLKQNFPALLERFAGTPLWLWLAAPMLAVLCWLAAGLLLAGTTRVVAFAGRKSHGHGGLRLFLALRSPARWLVFAGVFASLREEFPYRPRAMRMLEAAELAVLTYGIALLLYAALDYACRHLEVKFSATNRRGAGSIIQLLRKIGKVLIALFALLYLLRGYGFDVATIIAGLGIGGVAVALASQKTLENLLGGVMLVLDQPVRVGDFCKFAGKSGTVEEIGLRSIRLRALDRSLLTVPNADFVHQHLENLTARDRMLFETVIGVRYDTKPDKLRWLLAELNRLLTTHPRVLQSEPIRTPLAAFGTSALEIKLFAYINTADYDEFLALREDIFLCIIDLVHQAGTDFAFPTQTLHLEKPPRLP